MPSLGADMEAAILVEWLVKPGDQVKRGDIVAVVETQKGLIEAEVYESGVVESLLVEPGQEVPVGTPLARIAAGGGQPAATAALVPVPAAVATQPAVHAAPTAAPQRHRISPLARRLAQELGVDLHTVQGTGPGGAIQRADIERAAAAPPATLAPPTSPGPPPAARRPPTAAAATAMRAAIAAAMARSKREIPHYYLGSEIDLQAALSWLEEQNRQRPVAQRILPAALLLKAVALALAEVPELNGFWRGGGFEPSEAIHLGVAISLRQGGLIAPAIHQADQLSLDELMAALRDLVARARGGGLRASELADPTMTVTNLGDQGVSTVFGVIYPPQVALVGFGTIVPRPWAVNGMLGVRPIVSASLAADHRVSDGHRGARFLAALGRLLQEPARLGQ